MRLPTGITRNVFLLGLVSLFTDLSSEMLYPIIPIFLTSTLGATPLFVGLIEGVAEATASLLRIWSGSLSDRFGRRKPFVFAGYGTSALARPLLALAHGWPTVLAARVLDRFGKGLRSAPRDALIADSVNPAYVGRAFGFHRSMDQVGAVIGPLAGLALLTALGGDYRSVFLLAFIPSAISTALVLFTREKSTAPRSSAPVGLTLAGLDPRFKRFLLVAGIFAFGNSSDAFLILRAQQLGHSPQASIALFALFNATYVISAYPAGALSDRVRRSHLYLAGLAVFAAVYLGFGFVRSPELLWVLFAVYGFYKGLTDGVSRAMIVDLVTADRRATALGVHAAVVGAATLPASALAGLAWTLLGAPAPFFLGSGMAVAAALLFLLPVRTRKGVASTTRI